LKSIQNRFNKTDFWREREPHKPKENKRLQSNQKKMKLHRSLSTMQDIEDWIQSSDEEIENPKDSIEIIEKEQEKGEIAPGEIAPIYSMYPRKRFREESTEERDWILKRIENIPVSEAEQAYITKEMVGKLENQPKTICEERDLVQKFKLLRSVIKRLPPQQS
jgi:hypothetical protein